MPTAPPNDDTSGPGHCRHAAIWRWLRSAAGAGRYIRKCWRLKSLNNQREPVKANKFQSFSRCGNKYQDPALKPLFFSWLHILLPLRPFLALEMPSQSNLEWKLSKEQGPSVFILLQSALHTCGAREIMNNNNYMQPKWPLGPVSGCRSIV